MISMWYFGFLLVLLPFHKPLFYSTSALFHLSERRQKKYIESYFLEVQQSIMESEGGWEGERKLRALRPPSIQRKCLPEESMAPFKDGNACATCRNITIDTLLSPHGHILETFARANASPSQGNCIICVWATDLSQGNVTSVTLKIRTITQSMLEMSAVNAMRYSQIFTDDGTHASWNIPDRRRVLKPTLDYCVDLTRKWMEISLSQTDKSVNNPRDLPKRVIDVSGPTILLRDFSAVPLGHPSRQGLYIALSHRWGPPETMLRTLKSTITMMMIGIDTKKLSLGFQDAIKLTKLLGLDYIWIDCLCIVQDSKEDWDEESSKMNSYYGSSWLTIALGTESSHGCIPKRQGDSKDIYQIITNNDDILYLQDGDSEPRDSRSRLSNSILYDRGWTYQEEILAPRYLSFLEEQIVFRCGSYLLSEDGCHTQSMLLGIPTGELNTFENTSYSWSQIVTNYSPRKLTMAEDKLPALSGIAREFYKIAPSKYLAGLWQEEFLSQLLWSTVRRNVKPTKYRAPSWSWASIDGSVVSGSSRLAGTFVLEVQHVSTELEGSDLMGRVKGGSLTARGFIRTGMITNSIPNQRHTSISHFLRSSPYGWEPEKFDHYQTFVNFDVSGEAAYKAEKSVVYFLNVTEKGSLILLPVPKTHPNWKENTYERIGISHWQKKPKLWEVVDEEVERTRSAAEVLRLRALSRLEVVHII